MLAESYPGPEGLRFSRFEPSVFDVASYEGDPDDPEVWPFLRERCGINHRLRRFRTYVLHEDGGRQIRAFISIATGTVKLELDDKAPDPVGCIHVGFIGTDRRHRGRGYMRWMLMWATQVSAYLSPYIGCRGVGLNCRQKNREVYQRCGFREYGKFPKPDEYGELYRYFMDHGTTDTIDLKDQEVERVSIATSRRVAEADGGA